MPPFEPGTPEWELLLTRYVSGEATLRERTQVDAWAASTPEHAAELAAWRRSWRAGESKSAARFDARGAERALLRRLDAIDRTPPVPRVANRWAVGLAAAIGIIVTGAVFSARWWPTPAQQFREFASAPASRVTITLRDGSRLVLGPASRLRVPVDFGASRRPVELEGEAQFIVVHDARHPFVVHTSRGTIQDVGTTFVVRAYDDDAALRVAVSEGEVSCAGVSLRARDAASVQSDGRTLVERHTDIAGDFAWVQGALVFRDAPLRSVARDLSRTYDLRVTIADSALGDALVTASIGGAESVDDVLNEITRAVGARYTRTGRSVVIQTAPRHSTGADET